MQTSNHFTHIRTSELSAYVGEYVRLQGWLHNLRRLGGVNFIILRDGWGTVQAVTEQETDLISLRSEELTTESVIALGGLVVAEAQAPGGYELHQPHIEVITPVREATPIVISKREVNAALPNLLDHAAVANRHPTRRAVFRLAAGSMAAFRSALAERHFTEVQTPKIVASATESGANVFQIDYFGRPAYLAQSPQFYKQVMVGVFERVFEVGPVFRAEPHDTTRHINEYVSLDVEMGFIENHFTVMALLRAVLAEMFGTLAQRYAGELNLLNTKLPVVPDPIPSMHFSEAKELVYKLHGVDERNEPDLSPQEERWLGEWVQREQGSDFLFVTGYPMSKRPFYTHADPARPAYSNSFDLLFRGAELVTGGQRLHRYMDYLEALQRAKLPTAPFDSYLEAFRYGMPPHGGFAIGLERLLMQLLGTNNVRLTTLFPRDLNRLTP
jgi:nondiscriminating aspartyl-tRNA synthetase